MEEALSRANIFTTIFAGRGYCGRHIRWGTHMLVTFVIFYFILFAAGSGRLNGVQHDCVPAGGATRSSKV